jgi:hypothetical protein
VTTVNSHTSSLSSQSTTISTLATQSALTALTTRVTAVDQTGTGTVATLTTRMSNAEASITTLATSSALTALTTRVTTVEGSLSTELAQKLYFTAYCWACTKAGGWVQVTGYQFQSGASNIPAASWEASTSTFIVPSNGAGMWSVQKHGQHLTT